MNIIRIVLTINFLLHVSTYAMDVKPADDGANKIDAVISGDDNILCLCPAELIGRIKCYEIVVLRFNYDESRGLKSIFKRENDDDIVNRLRSLDPTICLNVVDTETKHGSNDWYSALDLVSTPLKPAAIALMLELGAHPLRTAMQTHASREQKQHSIDIINMHILASKNVGNVVVWFLSKCPSVEVNYVVDKKTLLDWSVIFEDHSTIGYLLSRGGKLCFCSSDLLIATAPQYFICKPTATLVENWDVIKLREAQKEFEATCAEPGKKPSVTLDYPVQRCAVRLIMCTACEKEEFGVIDSLMNGDFGQLAEKMLAQSTWRDTLVGQSAEGYCADVIKAIEDSLRLMACQENSGKLSTTKSTQR